MARRRRTTATRKGRKPDLWEAIRAFRDATDLAQLRIDEAYRCVRDRSPGRRVGP